MIPKFTKADPRIVSLLPSATEMACALGLGDQIVGITHCCDYPPEILNKPRVVHSDIGSDTMSLREVDEQVSSKLKQGGSLYSIEADLLRKLAPTHILTQDLCQVCAPAGNEVTRALQSLAVQPQVLWMSPHSISDIFENFHELGVAVEHISEAEAFIAEAKTRLEAVRRRLLRCNSRPRVFCVEWADPLYCSGHWVPEMIEIAGGIDVLGRKGADSVRVSVQEVIEAKPEVIIFMPCGFGSRCAHRQAEWFVRHTDLSQVPAIANKRVFAVDGAYFNRPGPRIIPGTELLAHLLHPELCEWGGPASAYEKVDVEQRSQTTPNPVCGRTAF